MTVLCGKPSTSDMDFTPIPRRSIDSLLDEKNIEIAFLKQQVLHLQEKLTFIVSSFQSSLDNAYRHLRDDKLED